MNIFFAKVSRTIKGQIKKISHKLFNLNVPSRSRTCDLWIRNPRVIFLTIFPLSIKMPAFTQVKSYITAILNLSKMFQNVSKGFNKEDRCPNRCPSNLRNILFNILFFTIFILVLIGLHFIVYFNSFLID